MPYSIERTSSQSFARSGYSLFFDDRLGSVITGKDGEFEIVYDREHFQQLFFDRKPDIYLRIRKADGRVVHTTEDSVRYEAGRTEFFVVVIDNSQIEDNDMEEQKHAEYSVKGRVDPKDPCSL